MTQEQRESLHDMLILSAALSGKRVALSFFEKRLGVVNAHVIDFRKSLQQDEIDFNEAVKKCAENGALEAL